MGTESGSEWSRILPWILLGRRTSHHAELGATPAQMVFGSNPKVPGELIYPMDENTTPEDIIKRVTQAISRPPPQTALHKKTNVYMPPSTSKCTHVWTQRMKRGPLDPAYDGPYELVERLGETSIKVRVGYYNDGRPRDEIRHWRSCQPCLYTPEQSAARPPLGRPRKSKGVGSIQHFQ